MSASDTKTLYLFFRLRQRLKAWGMEHTFNSLFETPTLTSVVPPPRSRSSLIIGRSDVISIDISLYAPHYELAGHELFKDILKLSQDVDTRKKKEVEQERRDIFYIEHQVWLYSLKPVIVEL